MSAPTTFLEQTGLDFTNPLFRDELQHLQANILKGHGRDIAWHIFLQFGEKRTVDIKAAVNKYARSLTSCFQQLEDTATRKKYPGFDGGMVRCMFLSQSGYKKMKLLTPIWIKPDKPYKAFLDGLKKRKDLLKDPDEKLWQKEFRGDIDAMILIADDTVANLCTELAEIEKLFGKTTIKHVQKGEVLRKDGLGIEHFGYADALSQPQYLNDYQPGKVWDDTMPLSAVLVQDPGAKNTNGAPDQNCYGSFFVFRKLEQHVKSFSEQEEALGNILFATEAGDPRKELAGAYLVGRFENSVPVVKHPTEIEMEKDSTIDNDFTYKAGGDFSKCPYHAHIRLTNPRNANLAEMTNAIPAYKTPARITRRGIPYDEAGRNADMDWKPAGDVGLLFMAYQSSFEDSFETMQASANIADGIIGQNIDTEKQLWPMQWGEGKYQLKGFGFEKVVTMKGGEYFFAPSIPFLKKL